MKHTYEISNLEQIVDAVIGCEISVIGWKAKRRAIPRSGYLKISREGRVVELEFDVDGICIAQEDASL